MAYELLDNLSYWSHSVIYRISRKPFNGSVKLYGTKNLADHCKTCSSNSIFCCMFFQETPCKHFTKEEGKRVKDAEVRMVVQGGTSFMFVNNPGLRIFAQKMIQIGSIYRNLDVNDVLFDRETVKKFIFGKMKECQEKIKKSIAECSLNKWCRLLQIWRHITLTIILISIYGVLDKWFVDPESVNVSMFLFSRKAYRRQYRKGN